MTQWIIYLPVSMCNLRGNSMFTLWTIINVCNVITHARNIANNDLEELLIETLADKLFAKWEKEQVIPTRVNADRFRMVGDLKGLYNTLRQHPALMDRRLAVGGRFPPAPLPIAFDIESSLDISKRSSTFDAGIAQPVCPYRIQWERLILAKDKNNTEVEVFQPTDHSNRYQWFYTATCDFDRLAEENAHCPVCCRAINHRRYTSQCVPRKTYVMALVRPLFSELEFDWDYIQVDTSCNCAAAPKQH